MLREITAANRIDGAFERRWYQDDLFDLYVWLDPRGAITHFQLAYDKPTVEKAIDWKDDVGFMHYRVDQSRMIGGGQTSPVLTMDPRFPKQRVMQQFNESASAIDIGVAAFISRMLRRAPTVYYRDNRIRWAVAGVVAGALLIMWRIL